MEKTIVTNSPEETSLLGEKIAEEVKNGGVVCLYGDLGSGKTTFAQGFANHLGITQHVISPTFLILRTYRIEANSNQQIVTNFYHIDLYRLGSEKEIEDVGLIDLMKDPDNIIIIEWAEKLKGLLPEKRIDIRFEYIDEEKRKITVSS